MKRKKIRSYYEDTDRVSVVGERVDKHFPVDEVVDLEERIKKNLDPETRKLFNKIEDLHSEREAYSQEMGYVQGWKDAEKHLK